MIVYMDRASIESLTVKDIREIVVKQSYQMKYQKLERYYVGDHDILHSERTDKTGGDNRIVNNMARYITDTATGYSWAAGGVQLRERGISADHPGYLRL